MSAGNCGGRTDGRGLLRYHRAGGRANSLDSRHLGVVRLRLRPGPQCSRSGCRKWPRSQTSSTPRRRGRSLPSIVLGALHPGFHPRVCVIFYGCLQLSVTHLPFPSRQIQHRLQETLWQTPGFCGTWACCASSPCLPRCSSGGHCGRAEPEGRNPASRLSLATRQRFRAHGQLRRSYTLCVHALPCHQYNE